MRAAQVGHFSRASQALLSPGVAPYSAEMVEGLRELWARKEGNSIEEVFDPPPALVLLTEEQ
eukprot:3932967-Prorocentrum_lima.AAC.1